MLESLWTSNETIDLFTDSAGGKNMGFGIYFGFYLILHFYNCF